MRRNLHPLGKSLLRAIAAWFALTPAFAGGAVTFPAWLVSYPGVTPAVHASDSLTESSYTAAAQPDSIVEHYRKLFEAAGLPFQANFDGVGTSIRAQAPEGDLLIQIRSRSEGAFVDVNCSAKSGTYSASAPPDVQVMTGRPQSPTPVQNHLSSGDLMERHRQIAAEMGRHRVYHDAPAPPLVWPSWLAHVRGASLRPERGLDQAKNTILVARYITNVPMTEIYKFYRDLLNAHEYPARSTMSTGHTMTGIQQNALGSVEGFNYPDGAPGAYSVIDVRFDRSVLNGPITVTMRFSTHDYIGKRGY